VILDGKPYRRTVRLPGFDYSSSGYYFVTICTFQKEWCLGEIIADTMTLNQFGKTIDLVWKDIPKHNLGANLDCYQIMPNHIHGIIVLSRCRGIACNAPTWGHVTAGSLSCVIRSFKSECSKQIGFGLWQRNYYEHIIRNEVELNKIREYIHSNPVNWEKDEYCA